MSPRKWRGEGLAEYWPPRPSIKSPLGIQHITQLYTNYIETDIKT